MQFLNTWAFWGLSAIIFPIIIHFINLKKIQTIEFPSLYFLKELKKNKLKKLKLLNLLLLLIRILLIVFLVITITRPVLKNSFFVPLPSATTSTVFIIDDTFSMNNYSDDNITNFNKAKDFIYKFRKITNSNDQVALIYLSDIEKSISLSNVNNNFFENVKNLNITYGIIPFSEAFNKAIEFLSKSSSINKEIFIISDFQANLFEKFDINRLKKLSKINVYFVPFQMNKNRNLSITNAYINNKLLSLDNTISLTFTIKNHYKDDISNSLYNIYLNDKKISQNSFSIKGDETKTITQNITINNTEFNKIRLELLKDENPFDNNFYLCIKNPNKITILNLYDDPNNLSYIQKALSADITKKIVFTNANINDLAKIDLQQYNLIFLSINDFNQYLNKLKNALNNSNIGLIVIPGLKSTVTNFNKILEYLNLPISKGFVQNNEAKIKDIPSNSIYNNIFKGNASFNEISVTKYYQFQNNNSYINLTNNDNFVISKSLNKNKILIFAAPLDANFTDFQYQSLFVPVIFNSIFYVSNNDVVCNNYNISYDGIYLDNYKTANSVLISPNNSPIYNIMQNNLFKPTQTGFYQIQNNNKIENVFTVNYNLKESILQQYNIDNILDHLKQNNIYTTQINYMTDITKAVKEARTGTEFWPIFLILSIFLLFLEIIISNNLNIRRNNYE